MTEQLTNKLIEYLDAIGEALGVAAPHVYELMIRQQVIGGSLWVAVIVVLMVVIALLARLSLKKLNGKYRKESYRADEEFNNALTFWKGTVWAFGIVVLFILALCLPHNIVRIVNPEYYVIKELLSIIS